MADERLYGKFTLEFPRNSKIAILSDAAFRCLVEATLYSRDELTDGFLARRYAVARWSLEVLQELATNHDEKPSLIECDKGWYIHDYAEHQDTKAEVEARRERNKRAGQRGGQASARQRAKQAAQQVAEQVAEHHAEQVGERSAERTVNDFQPETETETETETSLLVASGGGVASRNAHARNGATAPPPQGIGDSRKTANEPPAACRKHPAGWNHDEACTACGRLRKHAEAQRDTEAEIERQRARERAEWERGIHRCPVPCPDSGMIFRPGPNPDDPKRDSLYVRCPHDRRALDQLLHEHQLTVGGQ